MTKNASDLGTSPKINMNGTPLPELPIKSIAAALTKTEGAELDISTRTTPAMAEAIAFGYPFVKLFGNSYVQDLETKVECLAISHEGQGRRDLIDCLQAGGVVPDAYYTGGRGNGNRDTSYVRYDSD